MGGSCLHLSLKSKHLKIKCSIEIRKDWTPFPELNLLYFKSVTVILTLTYDLQNLISYH